MLWGDFAVDRVWHERGLIGYNAELIVSESSGQGSKRYARYLPYGVAR